MKIIVIGAGAAGMLAAAEAARRGADVTLLEKNGKTGVKILMSGGTRCNLTHDTDARGITTAFGHAQRFLQPSVGAFPPSAVVQMFRQLGVTTKTEATGKIFPTSNRAVQVRDALQQAMLEAGVQLRLRCPVNSISRDPNGWRVVGGAETLRADRVIVTVGGRSWPGCGTTGDGYAWLRQLGHTIVPPRPALVPLVGGTNWMHDLSGLTLADTLASVHRIRSSGADSQPGSRGKKSKRPVVQRRSSWLFTHFGFSGPAAMDVSGAMTAAGSLADVQLTLDLLPDVDEEQLRRLLTERAGDGGRRRVAGLLGQWLPARLADAVSQTAGAETTLAELSKTSLHQLLESTKRLVLPISGTRGFAKAEVTAGGVRLSEINPKSMESRLVSGLHIAGELLDVDGWIGGYNFQAAFSTGRAAGIAAASAPPPNASELT